MFACLYLPPPVRPAPEREEGRGKREDLRQTCLVQLARDFSPRIEVHGDRVVTLDVSGLGSLLGDARAIGEELRRTAADQGLRVHVAVAATSTAAILLAHARAGLTVVPLGAEAATLASLPLRLLSQLDFGLRSPDSRPSSFVVSGFSRTWGREAETLESTVDDLLRWGLRTLGDLAAIPAANLSERLGQDGLLWQRWARGEEVRPLVPAAVEEQFESSLDLDWPIEELEPLSFVFARLFDPLCERLERRDRGAVALHVKLKLVTRATHERTVQLPAPMRDARVLRTLALLDLESNPPPAGVDRVTVVVDVTEGRVLQFGLFARALPAEKLATLLARLAALIGGDRVGAPALVDSYRPGAFAMKEFAPAPDATGKGQRTEGKQPSATQVLRRFRFPISARVALEQGRPVHVTTDRRGFAGGRVTRCEGPWRSSGDWWLQTQPHRFWNCDEWDIVLADGTAYRISQARHQGTWSVDGMLD
jgi:protein ImuB